MAASRNFDQIGERILLAARGELYLNLPYLDAALCGLGLRPGGEITLSLAADGETLYYNGSFLAERYLRGRVLCNRAYLHVILHCMLRHLAKKQDRVPELWDLACDAAVESILDALHYHCLENGPVPAKQTFYGLCRAEMPVLTAEGIYRFLLKERYPEYRLAQLQRVFLVDDHGLWAPPEKEKKERTQRQDRQWKNRSDKTRTAMETVLAGQAEGGEPVLEQVRAAVRDDVDYRAFLRRFAAPREVPEVDGDGFDYSYYSYGLRLYGNLPLIEYPETREEKRIRDFVIAIDTSMSTKGELVRQFLACTYAVLRSTETFTRKMNIRILQCDDRVRKETVIRDLEELRGYMEDFQLSGGSATDFRPVFHRVEELQKQGAFNSLQGLIYFTDGMGIYPGKRPPYDVAFILLEEPPISMKMPPWAIRLVLDAPALEKACRETDLSLDTDINELPEL
ncbi:MAG: VWA-like domain-containing protein [Clostridiaceae bacterium]|nr:VWA-like domain-containing protein [Clostridia bacterium]MDY3870128.1 VWA-like domain-containing protein [Clostridiaceae bacterium]